MCVILTGGAAAVTGLTRLIAAGWLELSSHSSTSSERMKCDAECTRSLTRSEWWPPLSCPALHLRHASIGSKRKGMSSDGEEHNVKAGCSWTI